MADDERMRIEEFDFSVRAYNALKKAGVNYLDELTPLSDMDLLEIRNFGQQSVDEVRARLAEYDFARTKRGPVEWPYAVNFKFDAEHHIGLDDRPKSELTEMEQLRRQGFQRRVMRKLDARQRGMMVRRFGLDGALPQTLEEVAQSFEITRERVRQIEAKTMKLLNTTPLG